MASKEIRYEPVLPGEVKSAYRGLGKALHFGLAYEKDIRAGTDHKGKFVFNFYRGGGEGDGAKDTDFALPSFAGVPFPELSGRQRSLAAAYPTHQRFELRLENRLVIGMGQSSVYDNGLTLHPVFGCPYLPGSSLKGIARRTYIDEYHNGDEAGALADQIFCDLFGCTGDTEITPEGGTNRAVPSYYKRHPAFDGDLGDRRGALVFFDGLPTSAPSVVVDIVNPHYKPYYEQALPPADIYNPVPANFLAVEGGEFSVVLALDPGRGPVAAPEDAAEASGFARAVAALRLALTEDGIGGKTTVGYGRFRVTEEAFITDDPEYRRREAERIERERRARAEAEARAIAEREAAEEATRRATAAEARAAAGVVAADEAEYVPAANLKKRKGGAYRVDVRVATKDGRKYTFEPLVEELRGKVSKTPVFVNLDLEVGEVLTEVEITGVNFQKGIFNVSQSTVQKR